MSIKKLCVDNAAVNKRQYGNTNDDTVIAEQLEPVFLQVANEETNGQQGYDKRYYATHGKGHGIVVVKQLGQVGLGQCIVQVYRCKLVVSYIIHTSVVAFAGVDKAFYAGGQHGRYSKKKGKLGGGFAVQFLAQAADDGGSATAQAGQHDGKYLETANDEGLPVAYLVCIVNGTVFKELIDEQ